MYYLRELVVKSCHFFIFSLILLNASMVYGVDSNDYADEPIAFDESIPSRFWAFETDTNWIEKSKFTTPEEQRNCIRFSEGTIDFSYVQMLNRCEGVAIGLGYDKVCIDWKNNEFFREDDFSKVLVKLYGFSFKYPCWDWKGGVTAWFDTTHFDLHDHTIWDFLVWGRYSWCTSYFNDFGLNIGFLAKVGIDREWVIPIIGIDFDIGRYWTVNLVFPTDLSLHYHYNDCWSLVLTNRFWNVRHRLKASEPLSKGIVEYRNRGLDLGLSYELCKYLTAEMHIGSTYGSGEVKMADKNDHTVRHNKFKSSCYFGMSTDLKF